MTDSHQIMSDTKEKVLGKLIPRIPKSIAAARRRKKQSNSEDNSSIGSEASRSRSIASREGVEAGDREDSTSLLSYEYDSDHDV